MKRICALLFATLALALCLPGCVHEDLAIKLNGDGTGSVSTTIGLRRDVYDQLAALGESDPFEGKETFEVEYDDGQYVAFTETTEYASFEDIEAMLAGLTYDTDMFDDTTADEDEYEDEIDIVYTDDVVIPDDVIIVDETDDDITAADTHIFKSVDIEKSGSKYTFHAVLNALPGQTEGYDMSDVLKASITVEMPGKVTDCKGGAAEDNKVVFDLSDMSHETELYAESKTTSAVPFIIIGAGVAVIAAVAIIFLRKKRK